MRKRMVLVVLVSMAVGMSLSMVFAQQQPAVAPVAQPAGTSQPAEAAKVAPAVDKEVRTLLGLLKTKEMMVAQLKGSLPVIAKQIPSVPLENLEKAFAGMDTGGYVDVLVPVYAKHLSLADLKAANAFFGSEAGQHFGAAQVTMQPEITATARQWGTQFGARLVAEAMKLPVTQDK